jgi:hypothetical protein
MNSKARSNALENERAFRFISYTLVFLMLICVIMAIGTFIHNVVPGWPSDILVGVMLLVVIDRFYTYPRFKALPPFSSEWVVTFGAQWIVFVIFIRLLLSYAKGPNGFVNDMQLFVHGHIDNFFDPEFVVALLLAILAWYVPAQFLRLLDEIGLDQTLALRGDTARVESNVVPTQHQLANSVFTLGIALVIITALARIDFRAFATSSAGSSPLNSNRFSALEADVLLYFIFGLALLAQGRLMSLQTRWNVQRIPISSDNFARQWGLYSLIFLFLIVVVVSLLPTGDSLGVFSTLGILLGFLWSVLTFICLLIVGLALALLSIPFLLLGKKPPLTSPLPTPFELSPPAALTPHPASNAILILIRSILLWGALILVIVFSFTQFVRQHENLLAALRKAPVVNWLILVWEWLHRSAGRTRAGLSRALAAGWQSIVARLEKRRLLPPAGWFSLRSLDPRRRIYFFYLAMIRRSDQQGLRRKPSQTPSEYAVTLEKDLPSVSEDIDSITKAFVEARYSRHEVNAGKADIVKAIWGRIRRALQNRSGRE